MNREYDMTDLKETEISTSSNISLFWLYNDNYRTYNIDVARKLKSIYAAILLAEIASRYRYHKERNELVDDPKHGQGWFYYTQEDIEERTLLTRKHQDAGLEILANFGLIEKKLIGVPARRHFRLNPKKINDFFFVNDSTYMKYNTPRQEKELSPKGIKEKSTSLYQSDKLDCTNKTIQFVPIGQTGHIYKEPKKEPKKEVSDVAIGLANFLSSTLMKICPKIPELSDLRRKKWAKTMQEMLDGGDGLKPESPEEMRKVIQYIEENDSHPTGNFKWIYDVQSAEKFKEKYSKMWVQMMNKPKEEVKKQEENQKVNIIKANRDFAVAIHKKIKPEKKHFLTIGDYHVGIKIGNSVNSLPYATDGFQDKLEQKLRNNEIV